MPQSLSRDAYATDAKDGGSFYCKLFPLGSYAFLYTGLGPGWEAQRLFYEVN